jgi:dTDP-4-amino-4,6-dideoxygalactose transaminase
MVFPLTKVAVRAITTGEGGMAVTANPVYAEKLESLKKFGMEIKSGKTKFIRCRTNYKLSDILGAVGVEQMKKIDAIINRRIELANYYNKLLNEVDLIRTHKKGKTPNTSTKPTQPTSRGSKRQNYKRSSKEKHRNANRNIRFAPTTQLRKSKENRKTRESGKAV